MDNIEEFFLIKFAFTATYSILSNEVEAANLIIPARK